MTVRSYRERFIGIVALATLVVAVSLLALPAPAQAAEVTTPNKVITSSEELVEVLNSDPSATAPAAGLTADGTVKLLDSVTVTGDYSIYLEQSAGEAITLDLGGQALTLANGTEQYGAQWVISGGSLNLTGEGSLTANVPTGQDLTGIAVIDEGNLEVGCDVTVARAESATSTNSFIYVETGTLTVTESGTLQQSVAESEETYQGTYDFIQCGTKDNEGTASFTLDRGAVDIADNHWGIYGDQGATTTINGGTINHTSGKLPDGMYPDTVSANNGGELVINGGSIRPNTFVGASTGGTATVNDGSIQGEFYGEDAGSTITLNGGDVYGYTYAPDDVEALTVGYGATATVTNGAVRADVYAEGQGSNVTFTGGVVSGQLFEVEGGTITVTTAPGETGSAVFTHPVPPTMLSGIAASGTVLDEREVAFIDYYGTIESARKDITTNYNEEETTQAAYCATTSPEAVIGFVGFGANGPVVDAQLGLFKSWLGEDIPAADGAKMWVYATVVSGQTYTIKFTDENGTTLGEKTQTVDADKSAILCMIDVNAPIEMQPLSDPELPTITAGTYTVSVTPAGGQAAVCDFGVSSITLDLNGGFIAAGDGSIGALTGLYPPAKWSLSGSSAAAERPGYKLTGWTSTPEGYVKTGSDGTLYAALPLFTGEAITCTAQWAPDVVAVSRLWNPYNGAHLLTTDSNEVTTLEAAGWKDEGPVFSEYGSAYPGSTPVTRVYNPFNGDHLYSASEAEIASLVAIGWRDEGAKFYGSPETAHPVYRLWNSYQTADGGLGSHLWTADHNEYVTLPDLPPVGAWQQEGAVWYAVSLPE